MKKFNVRIEQEWNDVEVEAVSENEAIEAAKRKIRVYDYSADFETSEAVEVEKFDEEI